MRRKKSGGISIHLHYCRRQSEAIQYARSDQLYAEGYPDRGGGFWKGKMNLIEKSLQIALRAYAGKADKAGRGYILHPLRVMVKMTTDLEMSAARLIAA